ncbi:Uncharacterized protein ChrSV_1860 [Chromobacterium vaccinii]|nr:Uncharacterized protein ChrSW_1860 [Chromobacterium vaccinii]QND89318.1 Uncharacterized protein ChrSV_1860 [Chromobacterium vaccinii]
MRASHEMAEMTIAHALLIAKGDSLDCKADQKTVSRLGDNM